MWKPVNNGFIWKMALQMATCPSVLEIQNYDMEV